MAILKKELGLFETTIYGVGIILGAGIYALIGEGAGLTGNSLWISFAISAVIASFTGLSYAELATMFPKAAAEYVYVNKGLGIKLLAFLIGYIIIFTGIATSATVSLGFAGYFNGLFNTPILVTAISLLIILAFINYLGIKHSSRINVVFTLIEVSGLLIVIALAFTQFGNIQQVNYLQMTNGISGIFAATTLIFFAYLGFENIANVAEETRNPQKVMARAFILAIGITTVLYIFTALAAVTLATPQELSASSSPLAYAVSKTFLGENAFLVMSFIALFATANTVLISIIAGSRVMYGMARDKSLPHVLSIIHITKGTPYIAIVLFTCLAILLLFVGDISFIAQTTSLGAFLAFALVNASLLFLRYRKPNLERPFKTPLNIGKFPVLAFLGLLSSIFMLFQFAKEVVIFMLLVVGVGLLLYPLFSKKEEM